MPSTAMPSAIDAVITLPMSRAAPVHPSAPNRRIIGNTLGIIATSPATTPPSTAIITSVITPHAERKLVNRSWSSVFWIALTSGITPVKSARTPSAAPPCAATIGSMRSRTTLRNSP